MRIEVVYAQPRQARTLRLELPAGATLRDAIIAARLPLKKQSQAFGIFGRRARLDQPLADGDRVEIYRALAMDPKEARRRRAVRKA
jgi:putative ubiquitin-RnfH superfamily antitoxin RatB of RatAB toxin-antitoxin module